MSAVSNVFTVVTLVSGMSTFFPHSPLDVSGLGGFAPGVFLGSAAVAVTFRAIEDY